MMARLRRVTAVVVGAIVFCGAPSARAEKLSPASVAALQAWVDGVRKHQPRMSDQWVIDIARMSYASREVLNPAMLLLLKCLRGAGPFLTKSDEESRIVKLAQQIAQNPGKDVFLRRAIVLHTDAAILADRVGPFADSSLPPPPPPSRSGSRTVRVSDRDALPPLLTNNRFVLSRDGEVLGEVPAMWMWPFARSLADLLIPEPRPTVDRCVGAGCLGSERGSSSGAEANARFVREWYHTVAAYMLANGEYAEAAAHLDRATTLLPNDAAILFDRGCYAELFGLPMQQVLLDEAPPDRARRLEIPEAAKANADAEHWFGRALEADSSFVEARVRLARLLDVRKRHEEALAEIEKALAVQPGGVVGYYAHLFGGRAAQAAGRLTEARQHYKEASALFPGAQSARLSLSQSALAAADIPGAIAPVQDLPPGSGELSSDPWWSYHIGAGRDLDELLDALWTKARSAGTP